MIDLTQPISAWLLHTIYPGYAEDLPDIILGRWPAELVVTSDHKAWICETAGELRAVQVARPVPRKGDALDFRAGPDAPVSGRSRRRTPLAALYLPPADGWPYLTLQRWPPEVGKQVQAARGVYTWETHATEDDALAHLRRMAQQTGIAGWIQPPRPH